MRTFEQPNLSGNWKCIICGTNKEDPVVLVGIEGTEKGGNIKAEQIHLSCIDLFLVERHGEKYLVQVV